MVVPDSDRDPAALGDIDADAVDEFWAAFVRERFAADAVPPLPAPAFQFGDSAEMADRLLALVVHGRKRATAGSRMEYRDDGSDLPKVGELAVVCDGRGQPAALIETTDVRIGASSNATSGRCGTSWATTFPSSSNGSISCSSIAIRSRSRIHVRPDSIA